MRFCFVDLDGSKTEVRVEAKFSADRQLFRFEVQKSTKWPLII